MKDQPAWSRRRFLSARGLGESSGGLIGAMIAGKTRAGLAEQESEGHWCISRRAMGCQFSVYLPPTSARDPMPAGETALSEIQDIEDLLTVYRADSPMAYVNQTAAGGPVRVRHQLFSILQRSAELTDLTRGAFDVASGALVNAWGFRIGPKRVPSDDELRDALDRSGMRHVELDASNLTVRFRVEGIEINLGSIGKGYGIDAAIERLRKEFGIDCAMIQGGLSSFRAVGEPAGPGTGWLVGIQNPYDPSQRLATVRLRDRAMGTSGNANQYYEEDGQRYGHVLDPRSGRPVDTMGSATVLAGDAATADALATALFVMGLDKAVDFCHNHPDFAALLVLKPDPGDDPDHKPRVMTLNLPPEDVLPQNGTT